MKLKKVGQDKALATTQVARMKKGHSLKPMSGERRGKTTAPNRSTAIRTRFSRDTKEDTYCMNSITVQKAWSCLPLKNQNKVDGKTKIGNRRSDRAMFRMK